MKISNYSQLISNNFVHLQNFAKELTPIQKRVALVTIAAFALIGSYFLIRKFIPKLIQKFSPPGLWDDMELFKEIKKIKENKDNNEAIEKLITKAKEEHPDLFENPKFMLDLFKLAPDQALDFAGEDLLKNEIFMTDTLKYSPVDTIATWAAQVNFEEDDTLSKSSMFLHGLLKANLTEADWEYLNILTDAPDEIQNDKKFVLAVINKSPPHIQHVSSIFLEDPDVIAAVVKKKPEWKKFVKEENGKKKFHIEKYMMEFFPGKAQIQSHLKKSLSQGNAGSYLEKMD